jgi:uncharacterized protein YbjT (DUF2867 family)
MSVFVAGATGAVGKQLVPMLVANGHDVIGMTRTESKRDQLRAVGATAVVVDALDADAAKRAVGVERAMTEIRGASNDKAKRELGWRLRYPSWRQGFAEGLG